MLRNPDDRDRNATVPLSVAGLLGQQSSDSVGVEPQGRLVQYIIGGSGTSGKAVGIPEPTLPVSKK